MTNASNKNRPLILLIIILLLTNIAVVAYFLWPSKQIGQVSSEKNRYKLLEPLKNEVGFSDSQLDGYKKIKDSRFQGIKSKVEDLRKAKTNFYLLLSMKDTNDSLLNIYSDSIGYRQKLLDMETYHHFKALRSLCTPGQEAKYDTMVQHIVRRWNGSDRSKNSKSATSKKN